MGVTLHVRVWIEIASVCVQKYSIGVTLHVRVWIEMTVERWDLLVLRSPST